MPAARMPAVAPPQRHPINDVLESRAGAAVISALLGLGLAALFQRVCEGRRCVVVQGPGREELERYHYKLDGECYKYNVEPVACPAPGAAANKN